VSGQPPGVHFLLPRIAVEIVRAAGVGPGDLVFDLGAGLGALTAPLAASGARVVAVEINPGYARRLANRHPSVRVVVADLRTVPLPRQPFHVVANIPFATTSVLVRRLLDVGGPPLTRADLVVEEGAARRLAGPPRDAAARRRHAHFAIRVGRRLPPGCFTPPPRVAAAVVTIRRYLMSLKTERHLARLLTEAERHPDRAVRTVTASARRVGLHPAQPLATVAPDAWRALAEALTGS
jgi:23S rRNA (adenine-N6)-dimethyltransferase